MVSGRPEGGGRQRVHLGADTSCLLASSSTPQVRLSLETAYGRHHGAASPRAPHARPRVRRHRCSTGRREARDKGRVMMAVVVVCVLGGGGLG